MKTYYLLVNFSIVTPTMPRPVNCPGCQLQALLTYSLQKLIHYRIPDTRISLVISPLRWGGWPPRPGHRTYLSTTETYPLQNLTHSNFFSDKSAARGGMTPEAWVGAGLPYPLQKIIHYRISATRIPVVISPLRWGKCSGGLDIARTYPLQKLIHYRIPNTY